MIGVNIDWRVFAAAGAVAAVGLGAWWIYGKGVDAALQDIQEQNDAAEETALEAINDRRACVDAGGVWLFWNESCILGQLPADRGGR